MRKVIWNLDSLDNEFSLMSTDSQFFTEGGFRIAPIPIDPLGGTNWLLDMILGSCH